MLSDQPNSFQGFGENHTIETPEQTRLEFPIAGIGSRFLAILVDFLIQGAAGLLMLLVLIVLGITGLYRSLPLAGQWLAALAVALVFLFHFGYFAVFEIIWRGQTPGKRMMHIRVIKDDGRPLSVTETIGRNLLRIADQLPALYAIGITSMMLTARSQRLGDLVVSALVVREQALAELRPTWESTAPAVPVAGMRPLSNDELILIDKFLSRRHELPGNVRARMAAEILERLRVAVPGIPENSLSPEALLERLAYERRSPGGHT